MNTINKLRRLVTPLFCLVQVTVLIVCQVPAKSLAATVKPAQTPMTTEDLNDILGSHTYFSTREMAPDFVLPGQTKCGALSGATLDSASTLGSKSNDGNPNHILTYPVGLAEQTAINAINAYIAERERSGLKAYGPTPYANFGADFVKGALEYNVNPYLAVAQMVEESQLSRAGQPITDAYSTAAAAKTGDKTFSTKSYNGMGWGDSSPGEPHAYWNYGGTIISLKKFDNWSDILTGPDSWYRLIRKAYLDVGSVHHTDTYQEYVKKYTGNPNPVRYITDIYQFIDRMNVLAGTTPNTSSDCPIIDIGNNPATGTVAATGVAAAYLTNCAGTAAIACTAINQLRGIPYGNGGATAPGKPAPATTPSPISFLDCSALTGMAVYRAFGVNLGGICSFSYKADPHFAVIPDIHNIQPGDIVGIGTACSSTAGGTGHVAIVISYNVATKKLITVETSSTRWLSGIRGIGGATGYTVSLKVDNITRDLHPYEWAVRYIGDTTLTPGAN